MLYKGIDVNEILNSGKKDLIDGMLNSIESKKSRNKENKEVYNECVKVIGKIKEVMISNGWIKESGNRGVYDDVNDLSSLSDVELKGMYESLYSRRSYYKKLGNVKKVKELEGRLNKVKEERGIRNRKEVLG